MNRKVAERHEWQEALERVDAFAKTHRGKRIYGWRKEAIERSFAEAKENHGLRYARMLGIRNMREPCFLTAAVQNIKRRVASLLHTLIYLTPAFVCECRGLPAIWTCSSADLLITAFASRRLVVSTPYIRLPCCQRI